MSSQVFATSPLRLSLFGGGTDIPHVFNELGEGFTISAAIDLPIGIVCTRLPTFNGIKLKYSLNESIQSTKSIIHPIFKEALDYFNYQPNKNEGIEIISTASLPSGSGLGSSGSFTSSLVQCLSIFLNSKLLPKKELLRIATDIEIKSGNNQIGYQDQIAAIYGSIVGAKYSKNSIDTIYPSKNWTNGMKNLIESRGRLFRTNSREGLSSDFIHQNSFKIKKASYESILKIANP